MYSDKINIILNNTKLLHLVNELILLSFNIKHNYHKVMGKAIISFKINTIYTKKTINKSIWQ